MNAAPALIIWFTGLSGSGKSTLAAAVRSKLESGGARVLLLDGDEVRIGRKRPLGFTPDDIKENNRLVVDRCLEESPRFDYILVPVITPYRESRADARKRIGSRYREVFVHASVAECSRRDTKGLYAKARRGEITDLIGVAPSNPYEEPLQPDVRVETGEHSIDRCAELILDVIVRGTGRTST